VMPCVFVGDGPLRKRLERRAEDLGVADKVGFLGYVAPHELGRIYSEADMLALPSVSEAAPLVVVESLACGTPVLASRIAGLPSVVKDWETGFLFKPGDVGQLAMAIRFMAGDHQLRERMGAIGRERVLAEFPWPIVARQYLGLYRDVSSTEVEIGQIVLEPEEIEIVPGTAQIGEGA
jgi:glycosyltransferase involved in cell wall biosynthesis